MKAKTATWNRDSRRGMVETFLRRPAFDAQAETVAADVLGDIRARGDAAVQAWALKVDGLDLKTHGLRVSPGEIEAASKQVDVEFRRAAREADRRIAAFSREGLRKNWRMRSPAGGWLGEQFTPLDRVGVYVPGGKAPLASTALMTATLARVAGVPDIVACTPCGPDGQVNPYLLHAMRVAGATEVYRVGGIQAIGMMAYGTRKVRKVQKIAGPGGTYVTAAKRQVYGNVALDLVAGPSEIAILADETASARYVATDLLSQAEHGTGHEKALLVTTSAPFVDAVQDELVKQMARIRVSPGLKRVVKQGMLLVTVASLDEGMELINRFAPEHFELMVKRPRTWLKKVTHAGAVFIGPWTPESAGDFVAGPSHVLPTGGAAAMFAGLTVDDFRKRTSVIEFSKRDLKEALPVIEAFGRVENLDAHALSARIRFEEE